MPILLVSGYFRYFRKGISYILCSRNTRKRFFLFHILAGKLNTCFITVTSMVPEERLSSVLKRFILHLNSVIIQPWAMSFSQRVLQMTQTYLKKTAVGLTCALPLAPIFQFPARHCNRLFSSPHWMFRRLENTCDPAEYGSSSYPQLYLQFQIWNYTHSS